MYILLKKKVLITQINYYILNNILLFNIINMQKVQDNYEYIISYFKTNKKYITEKDWEIFLDKDKIQEDSENLNEEFINFLLKDDICQSIFFKAVKWENWTIYAFNQNNIIKVLFDINPIMENWNKKTYTKYWNNIWMNILDQWKIVLNFPWKDCILVWGMDKEDEKHNIESLYNEILDKDKIDILFKPKIFNNIKKYTYKKENKKNDDFTDKNNLIIDDNINWIKIEEIIEKDENGNEKLAKRLRLDSNLLIKWNNLLALHSLAKRFRWMIDVIYIDPPYYFIENKSTDTFTYNSNFKLSSWLTFNFNRFEIAKELLSENWVIFISMNEDWNSYLRLLCNEVFWGNNFIENLIWEKNSIKNNSKTTSTMHEYILFFAKNISNLYSDDNFKIEKEWFEEVMQIYNENILFNNITIEKKLKEFYSKNKHLKWISQYKMVDEKWIFRISDLSAPGSNNKNQYEILHPITNKKCKIPSWWWLYKKETMLEKIKNNLIYFWNDENNVPQLKRYLKNVKMEVVKSIIKDFYEGKKNLESLFGKWKSPFQNPKPISLIKKLIQIINSKNWIILDFFWWSWTTWQAVMDLNKEDNEKEPWTWNRKFILIEQLDYIENITQERLLRSMIKENYDNENLVYMEMMETDFKKIKREIKECSSEEKLIEIVDKNFNKWYFQYIKNKEELLEKINIALKEGNKKENWLWKAIKIIVEEHLDHNLDYELVDNLSNFKEVLPENEYNFNKNFYEINNI